MGTNRALFEANERVDLRDQDFFANTGANDESQQLGAQALTDPSGVRAWVLSGFVTTNPSGTQIEVTKGVGILSRREGGVVSHGMLSSEGDASKIIDVGTFSNDNYSVYVRFQYADGSLEGRAFWDSSSAQEITQTIATRRIAGWSMRIERSNPGAEWMQVATFTLSGGGPAVSALTDTRPLYFEGRPDDTYESGWSTDGGGVATDRNSDRGLYGVTNFQTANAATRQCLEDIKGRGLRRWWEADIGGINVGFATDPSEDVLSVGDVGFKLDYDPTNPKLWFQSTPSESSIHYARDFDQYNFIISGSTSAIVKPTGFVSISGADIGFDGTPVADVVRIGDTDFRLDFNSANPRIYGDYDGGTSPDFIEFNRTEREMRFYLENTLIMTLEKEDPGVNPAVNIHNRALISSASVDYTLKVVNTATGINDYSLEVEGAPTIGALSAAALIKNTNATSGAGLIVESASTTPPFKISALGNVGVDAANALSGDLWVVQGTDGLGNLAFARGSIADTQKVRYISPIIYSKGNTLTEDTVTGTGQTAFASVGVIARNTIVRTNTRIKIVTDLRSEAASAANTITIQVYLGDSGSIGTSALLYTVNAVSDAVAYIYDHIELVLNVTTTGSGGTVEGAAWSVSQSRTQLIKGTSFSVVSLDWTSDLDVFVTASSGASLTKVLKHLSVEVA